MKHKPIFITGIGTGIGKTITSAVLVESLHADYWKPIQSGDLDNTDTDRVRSLITNKQSVLHPEAYRLTQPFSPHKSAQLDNIRINLDLINLPDTDNRLIIEGAGGLLVPLNERELMIDLIEKLDAEVALVSQHYLGSINHTLLSLEMLKNRKLPVSKLIICGKSDESSEAVFRRHTEADILYIPALKNLDKKEILKLAEDFIY